MPTLTCVCHRLLVIGALLTATLLLATSVFAQQKQYTENKSDLALRSEARIDPATLGMSLEIPLGGAPGRAGTSLPISVRYSSKLWRMKYIYLVPGVSGDAKVWTKPKFSENAWSGWTSSLEPPRIEYTPHQKYEWNGNAYDDHPNAIHYGIWRIRRIHLYLPDGSSHELRRSDIPTTDNEPINTTGTYYSTDGSRLRFEADSNTLCLPDGSSYLFSGGGFTRFNNELHDVAWATRYTDRNGNTINYTLSGVTDTLGRESENPLNDPHNIPTEGVQYYAAPGVGGVPLNYILTWRLLNEVLSGGPVPATNMPYTGDTKCLGANDYQSVSPSPYLFASDASTKACVYNGETLFNPAVLSEIELPNHQKYQFKYNTYGEIVKITYPTGGYESFLYADVPALSDLIERYAQSNRGVIERRISAKGDGTDEVLWKYSGGDTVTITTPDNTYTERRLYNSVGELKFGFNNPLEGMAYDERSYTAPLPSGQMLRRTLTDWHVTGPLGGIYAAQDASRDPRMIKQIQILLDTGGDALAAATTTEYDTDIDPDPTLGIELNPISTTSYDYASVDSTSAKNDPIDSIPMGTPIRTQETTYLVNDSFIDGSIRQQYCGRQLLGLPSSTRTKSGTATGPVLAKSEIKYDETAPLTCGAATGWLDPGTTVRGMPTTTRSWLDTTSDWVTSHAQYDQCGSLRESEDARGNKWQVEYAGPHYAYPTLTKTPVPGMGGSPTALESSSVYDFTTGRIKQTVDANNIITKFEYDNLSRPSQTVRAYGTASQNQTSINYDDYNHIITTSSDKTTYPDNALVSKVLYDGLGRTKRTLTYENQDTNNPWLTTDIEYDSMGRVSRTSNPYRSTGFDLNVNPPGQWTTNTYDALGRVVRVQTPDGAFVTTAYSGNVVTVTDQALKMRRSVTDGLGRLTRVDEPNTNGDLGLVSNPTQPTFYDYDALDNLRSVSQGGQTRTFAYDSLKRLTSATNPESGTVCYGNIVNGQCQANGYDANGNLTIKSDARLLADNQTHVKVTYEYDALNRETTRTYNDGTLPIGRAYDQSYLGKGRLAWEYKTDWTNKGTVETFGYDPEGRVKGKNQYYIVNSHSSALYTTYRNYNLAGQVTDQSYPSLTSYVNYSYDSAGRTNSFTGNLGGNSRTYSTGILYSPLGGITKEQFGTNSAVYNKSLYNSRGQLAEILASTNSTDGNADLGKLTNWYSSNCGGATCNNTDNNGNLIRQDVDIPNGNNPATSWYQQYHYDSLNRLDWVHEYTGNPQLNWHQEYVYDRWGNRKIHQTNTSGPASGPAIPKPNFGVDVNSNRLTVPGGYTMTYDNGGNVTFDNYTGPGQMVYDAENRMTESEGGVNAAWRYTYNAAGQRVTRKVGSEETWLIYGIDGELVAEYPVNGAPASPLTEYGYRNGQLLIKAEAASQNAPSRTYHASTDFTSSQGSAGVWYYRDSDGTALTYLTQWGGVWNRPNTWLFLGGSWGHPEATSDAVRRWQAPGAGSVHITVTAYDGDAGGGDGVIVSIKKGTTVLWQQTIDNGDPTGVSYDHTIDVALGDQIDFVINKRGTTGWDTTIFDPTIAFTSSGNTSAGVRWLVTDQLGTPRIIVDQTGSLANMKRHDYLPFGEELVANQGLRTTGLGYTGDIVRQKFTRKERDIETGLDNFGARYYANTQGRFTSADEPFADQYEDDPQSWNLYTYAGNNPLLFTDPTGMWKWLDPDKNGNRFIQWEKGDDWYTLSNFLNQETGRDYLPRDLASAYSSGGLGENTIVDVTGAPSHFFTATGGVVDTSWDVYLTVLPAVQGLKAAGGLLRGAAGLFAREAVTATETAVSREAINMTSRGLAHVLERHAAGGAKTAAKSIFNAGEDIAGLIGQAGKSAPVQQAGRQTFQRVVDAGRIIGVDRSTGQATSIYTVITNAAGDLITAFPGKP